MELYHFNFQLWLQGENNKEKKLIYLQLMGKSIISLDLLYSETHIY